MPVADDAQNIMEYLGAILAFSLPAAEKGDWIRLADAYLARCPGLSPVPDTRSNITPRRRRPRNDSSLTRQMKTSPLTQESRLCLCRRHSSPSPSPDKISASPAREKEHLSAMEWQNVASRHGH